MGVSIGLDLLTCAGLGIVAWLFMELALAAGDTILGTLLYLCGMAVIGFAFWMLIDTIKENWPW